MAWQPNRLLTYYSDRVNIYDDERFARLPDIKAPPAPPVVYIHRTTHFHQPYPIPYTNHPILDVLPVPSHRVDVEGNYYFILQM